MNVKKWRAKNRWHLIKARLLHPPPFYKKSGGINAVVIRADGTRENLGKISATYSKRWGVSSGQ